VKFVHLVGFIIKTVSNVLEMKHRQTVVNELPITSSLRACLIQASEHSLVQ